MMLFPLGTQALHATSFSPIMANGLAPSLAVTDKVREVPSAHSKVLISKILTSKGLDLQNLDNVSGLDPIHALSTVSCLPDTCLGGPRDRPLVYWFLQ